jgi:hypothetical protein
MQKGKLREDTGSSLGFYTIYPVFIGIVCKNEVVDFY